jgi:hypothetical protein
VIDAAKDKSAEAERRAKDDFQQLKVRQSHLDMTDIILIGNNGLQDKAAGVKSTVAKDLRASEVRGKSIGEDLESKYESAKGATRDGLNRARESTENLYQEARSSAEHKAHDTREAAEKKAAEAKQGWFSWLGWGKK